METGGDCVRVMTIHAAKGLEAKIVFLPDTCGVPSGRHDAKIHVLEAGGTSVLAWSPRKETDPPAVAAARQRARAEAEDEHRRLLYVALTRAEERIYISGYHGSTEPNELAWSQMIGASLGENFVAVPAFWDEGETIRRWFAPGKLAAEIAAGRERVEEHVDLPAFLTRAPAFETAPLPPLKPSSALAAADTLEPQSADILPSAALRGRLMHVLLQHLPDVAPDTRRDAAHVFLAASAGELDASARDALIDEALAVLEMPSLADLFSPRARAEVAVVGHLAGPGARAVSGQIDRLVETESEVIVADFKTGTPCTAATLPRDYLVQIALYRAVLSPLWPGKRLRMLLIFMAGPKVVELGDEEMDEALVSIGLKRH